MLPTRLYRGDSQSQESKAQHYRSAGLLTKVINGGNPAYIEQNGLLESVRAHVKAQSESESFFQKRSQFLSFSSQESRAMFYASSGHPNELVSSEDNSETRYIFTIDTTNIVSIKPRKGLHFLEYSCDNSLIRSDGNEMETPGIDPLASLYGAFGSNLCEGCDNRRLKHRLLLIDVVAFLNAVPSAERYKGALTNAQQDHEWLIMPSDYIPRLFGDSARIPRSQIWSARHYRLRSESPRDATMFAGGSDVAGFE